MPRAWLEDGKTISVDGVQSHFGRLSYRVESKVGVNRIKVSVNLDGACMPEQLIVRIPHPCEDRKAISVSCGCYDAAAETVTLDGFTGYADFEVIY